MLGAIASVGQTPTQTSNQADQPGNAAASGIRITDSSRADEPSGLLEPGADPENRLFLPFLKHMAEDQEQFWARPKELKKTSTLKIFLPFAGFTGALIAGDSWFSKQVPDPSQIKRSKDISNYAVFSLIGAAGGAYAFGHLTHNDHLSETGFLSGEAALNSTLVAYAFKEATRRERPYQGNGNGNFFQGGSSFPSEHAAIAWSVASVVAHEYPGTLTQIGAYGLASAVTLTRVTGKQHFPSDVVIGSALGWYLGRQIYRAHHDPELGGQGWGELVESKPESPRNPANMGSPYVPLDSWVYPAIERLSALGYIDGAFVGMRPWTRMECARLVEQASERIAEDAEGNDSASRLYDSLAAEFAWEARRLEGAPNLGINLNSVYTRTTNISGPLLRDSYHFAQTIANDSGRPYGEGISAVAGLSTHAVAGPFSFDVQGEYQHAPENASYPVGVLQAIANTDQALPLANGTSTINRFTLLNATAGITLDNVYVSFGRQSAWLGPAESGSLLLSDNAPSITMLRFDNVTPFRVPLLSRLLGPVRAEFFVGQLDGHHWVYANTHLVGPNINPQPFLHSNKVSFKPTPNLELGMGLNVMFGGPSLPFTWANFLRSFYSHKASVAENPGKRFSSFDFSYRVPGVRKWLTFYLDSLVVDEISPIGSTRPSLNLGLYMPQIPKIPKLELRLEGIDTAPNAQFSPGYVYADRRYKDGYTSDGNILGNAIGRAGRGGQGWVTYSFTPRNRLQVWFRHVEADHAFLEGGHVNDFGIRTEVNLHRDVAFSASAQYERWAFPLLAAEPQTNVTSSIQLTYTPRWGAH
ncbi:MAG: capsule assembly Wzi family protein [Terriglobales bacterium]